VLTVLNLVLPQFAANHGCIADGNPHGRYHRLNQLRRKSQMMRVVPYRPEQAPALYDVYRRMTAGVAHCRFAPSAASFAQDLSAPMQGTQLLVADDGGAAVGFAALLQTANRTDRPTVAEITALFAADELADQALVEACIAIARNQGVDRLTAFDDEHSHCPIPAYNAGWSGLSDAMPRAARVLARAGFVPYHRELHLSCPLDRQGPLAVAAHLPALTLFADPVADRSEEHTLRALLGGERVGVCVYSTLAHLSDDAAASRWGYIVWLHVEEAYRRRGVARYLLTNALATLAAAGCTGCWLTTGGANWPALTLYLSLGFEIVDTSTCFRKALG
jgi:ribosomal protein S18 acetylase RimI-like enzyme